MSEPSKPPLKPDWANDPDYDDEGNLDVEWYPDPEWLQNYDEPKQTDDKAAPRRSARPEVNDGRYPH